MMDGPPCARGKGDPTTGRVQRYSAAWVDAGMGLRRAEVLEFLLMSGGLLSALSPVTGTYNTAFIFKNDDAVWPAMDGAVGSYVRGLVEKVKCRAEQTAYLLPAAIPISIASRI